MGIKLGVFKGTNGKLQKELISGLQLSARACEKMRHQVIRMMTKKLDPGPYCKPRSTPLHSLPH